MKNMWKVSFNEYLKFDGVKEGIRNMKKQAKIENAGGRFGLQVEEVICKILAEVEGFEVKHLSPQMDIGFGADAQVSYMENGKNYSFHVDVTTRQKEIEYITHSGDTTPDIDKALCYYTEYFNVRFGLKERHVCHFFYEKPVLVLYIDNYVPSTGLALHHIHNIGEFLMSVNSLLMKMGYGARASQMVRPNLSRFRNELKK